MTLQTTVADDSARQLALLKAVGLDRADPAQRELAIAIANNYGLDLMLKHVVLIEGRPYITRDGLLHIAHSSGQLDGIEASEPTLKDGFWRSTCSVYRKDMSRPFTYYGRYPEGGRNKAYAPEMALKVAESMALRRAFDIAAPSVDEKWDADEAAALPAAPEPVSLTDRIATRAGAIAAPPAPEEPTRSDDAIEGDAIDEGATEPLLAAPMDETTSAALPVEDPDDIDDEPAYDGQAEPPAELTMKEFGDRVKGIDRATIRNAAKTLFPDVKKFADLDGRQLLYLAVALEDAIAIPEPAPSVEPEPAPELPPEPASSIEYCGDVSPLSGATCTLDKGHGGKVHRAGLKESW